MSTIKKSVLRKVKKTDPYAIIDALSEEEREDLALNMRERWTLFQPSILILEDQPFSQMLLSSMLSRDYPCYSAQSIKHAMEIYLEHAPCISLLDIKLDDGSGHLMAEAVRSIDPDGYLVMVTANNYQEDVEKAQANNINGFIIKPYNKKKILAALRNFKQYKRELKRHAKAS